MSGHTPGPWYVFSSRGVIAILDDRGNARYRAALESEG